MVLFEDDYDDEEPSLLDKLNDKSLGLGKKLDYEPIELPELEDKRYDDWKTNEFRLTGKHPDFDIETPCDYDPDTDSTMNHYLEAIEMSKDNVICKEQEDLGPKVLIAKDKPLDKVIETPFDYKPGLDSGMNSFLKAIDSAKKLP